MRPKWVAFLIFISFLRQIDATNCSGRTVLNATTTLEYITTPNYETNGTYPPFLDCSFIIKAPDKTRIIIEIIDLDMEPKLFTQCVDQLSIFDGTQVANKTSRGEFCEKINNWQMISEGDTVLLVFKSDDLYEFRGANISYHYFDASSCPDGWQTTDNDPISCLRLSQENSASKTDWISAQRYCNQLRSNLVTISTKERLDFIQDHYNQTPGNIWIGYHDGESEGDYVSVFPNNNYSLYLDSQSTDSVADNNDDNDCMVVNLEDPPRYEMKNCIETHFYICEMKKDFSTIPLIPPVDTLREGSYTRSSQFALWILLFLIVLLFFLVIISLCYMCWKQKEKARIHNQQATNVQQNAFMNDPQQANATSTANNRGTSPNTIANNNSSRLAGTKVIPLPQRNLESGNNIRENSRKFPKSATPNQLPIGSNEPSIAENMNETHIMGNDSDPPLPSLLDHPEPKPQPRTLPPAMPMREATFQSVNTRDGSTVRTKRNKDLFDRPKMHVLDNVSAISLDEFWSNKK